MANEKMIFLKAVAICSVTERSAYLDRACGDDTRLREQVERLLAVHDNDDGKWDTAEVCFVPEFRPPSNADDLSIDDSVNAGGKTNGEPTIMQRQGDCIGPYRLFEKLGETGCAVVYRAEQKEPVERQVALKIIKLGLDAHPLIARFHAEQEVLAKVDHPYVATVYDAGIADNGHPYFVTEFVGGIPFNTYCDTHQMPLRKRLELFVQVCHAVQHAHQHGIIHRDLKPTNVLVTERDQQPVPKVIDIGMPKPIYQNLSEHTASMQLGQIVGILNYMSPEQTRQDHQEIDIRSDVYSLGAMAYELLTGTPPLDGQLLRSATFGEMQTIVRDEEPPKPSARIATSAKSGSTFASARCTTTAKLRQVVRGDLDWIVMKALEKDCRRRYETADALADDIQRFLNDQPVILPLSFADRFQQLVRRNRTAFATATTFLILSAAFTLILLFAMQTKESEVAVAEILNKLMIAPPSRVDAILAQMQPYRDAVVGRLWEEFRSEDILAAQRFRAGIALGVHAPFSPKWKFEDFRFLESFLNDEPSEHQAVWQNLLGPLSTGINDARAVVKIGTIGDDSIALTQDGVVHRMTPTGLGPSLQPNVLAMEVANEAFYTLDFDSQLHRLLPGSEEPQPAQQKVVQLAVVNGSLYTLDTGGTLRWQPADGQDKEELPGGFMDMAVADGLIYLIDTHETLHVLQPRTRQLDMLKAHVTQFAVVDDTLYALDVDGFLFQRQPGQQLESLKFRDLSNIAASNGTLYLLDFDGRISQLLTNANTTEVLQDNVVQLAASAESLYTLHRDGSLRQLQTNQRLSEVLQSGVIRMVGANRSLYLLDSDHNLLRRQLGGTLSGVLQRYVASLAVWNDSIYTLDFSGTLSHVSTSNALDDPLQQHVAQLAVACHGLFTRDMDGNLRRMRPKHKLSVLQHEVSQLAVANGGQLFTRDFYGELRQLRSDDTLTDIIRSYVQQLVVAPRTRRLYVFDFGGKFFHVGVRNNVKRPLPGAYRGLVAAYDSMYMLDLAGNLCRITRDHKLMAPLLTNVLKTIIANNALYTINIGGGLFRVDSGDVPNLIPGYFTDARGIHDSLYTLDIGGHLRKHPPLSIESDVLQDTVAQMAVAGEQLYTLDFAGQLHLRSHDDTGTRVLQTNVAEATVAYEWLYTRDGHDQLRRLRTNGDLTDVLQQNIAQLVVACGPRLYTRNLGGELRHILSSDEQSQVLQDNVIQLACCSGHGLYTLDSAGHQRMLFSDHQLTEVLQEHVEQMVIANGGLIYILDSEGRVREFLNSYETTDVLQTEVAHLAVGNGSLLYSLDRAGKLRLLLFKRRPGDYSPTGSTLYQTRSGYTLSDVLKHDAAQLASAFGPRLFTLDAEGSLYQVLITNAVPHVEIENGATTIVDDGHVVVRLADGFQDWIEFIASSVRANELGQVISLNLIPQPGYEDTRP